MAAAAILKIAFLAINHWPIVRCQQNFGSTRATGQNMQMCKIQDGGRPPFWKSLNRHISVKNCPILMKFCTLHQILNPVTVMSAAILKFAFLAITDRPIVRFRRNFVYNGMPTKATWYKLQVFKIQAGGRPPFWKSLNYHIPVKILLDFDKIWCTTACIEPDEVFKSAIAEF